MLLIGLDCLIDCLRRIRYFRNVMSDKFPCLSIKQRKPSGHTCEIEIRPSFLKWLLIVILVIISMHEKLDPVQLLRSLLHQ